MMQHSILRVSQRHRGITSAQCRRYAAGKDSLNLKSAKKGNDPNGGAGGGDPSSGGGLFMLPVAVIATTVAAGWYFRIIPGFSREEFPVQESSTRPTLKRASTRSFPGFIPDSEHAEGDSENAKLSRQKTQKLFNDARSTLQRSGTQTKETLQEASSKLKRASTRSFPGFIAEANHADEDSKNAKLSRQKTQKLFNDARSTLQRSGTQTKETFQEASSKLKRASTRSFPGFIAEANHAGEDSKNAKLSRQKTQKLFNEARSTLQRSGTQTKEALQEAGSKLKRATTRSFPEPTSEAKQAEDDSETAKAAAQNTIWERLVALFRGR